MLFLYSKTILSFQKKVKRLAFDILKYEVGLQTNRSRFKIGPYFYPLSIVVFEDQKKLGYFDRSHYTIALNKKLMMISKEETLKDIIRHELAHYLVSIFHSDVEDHGREFREVCSKYGWGKLVYSAYTNIEIHNENYSDKNHDKLISRLKKVLALASSDNIHEAQAATIKANELLLNHNLKSLDLEESVENESCLKKVLEYKRSSTKLGSIYEILETFFVQPVINHGKGKVYLEVIGPRANVEMADYVAKYLDHELEALWKTYKKNHPKLKGLKAKNSFFRGLSDGYVNKIKQSQTSTLRGNELIILRQDLETKVQMVYSRMGSKRTYFENDRYSEAYGRKAGSNLSIRPAIKTNESIRLINN